MVPFYPVVDLLSKSHALLCVMLEFAKSIKNHVCPQLNTVERKRFHHLKVGAASVSCRGSVTPVISYETSEQYSEFTERIRSHFSCGWYYRSSSIRTACNHLIHRKFHLHYNWLSIHLLLINTFSRLYAFNRPYRILHVLFDAFFNVPSAQ